MVGSQPCLNELSPEVIGHICSVLELGDVASLFKIGNRLLTTKMCSESGIRRYHDESESGVTCNHFWLLCQLQGINTVSLSNLPTSSTGKGKLLDLLPKTVTSLHLSGREVCENCFGNEDQTDTMVNLASRFPQLFAFSLQNYFELRLTSAPLSKEYFQSFPLTLRQLRLDLTYLEDIPVNEIAFPVNLEHLDLSVNNFELGWVLSLNCSSHLHTLKVHSQELYGCSPITVTTKNENLRTLHLWFDWPYRSLRGVKCAPTELKQVLSALPALEEFQTHFGEEDDKGPSMFTVHHPQLRTLVCGSSQCASYGTSLTKLEFNRDIIDRMPRGFDVNSIVQLSSLREFYDPWLQLESNQYDLLPKSLTALTVWSVEPEMIKLLPPLLVRVGTIQSKTCDYDYDSEEFSAALNSLPHLTLAEVDNGQDMIVFAKTSIGWAKWQTSPLSEAREHGRTY